MTILDHPGLMTAEELLAMPDDDGVGRELIRGVLSEEEMTRRGQNHTLSGANIAAALKIWSTARPKPRGRVLVGEAAFLLARKPDTTVGIDVAYISPEVAKANPREKFLIDGKPNLAVEIFSPSDTYENVTRKISVYLEVGIPITWIVDPVFLTVMVFKPDAKPALFTLGQELDGGDALPGLRVPVESVFED